MPSHPRRPYRRTTPAQVASNCEAISFDYLGNSVPIRGAEKGSANEVVRFVWHAAELKQPAALGVVAAIAGRIAPDRDGKPTGRSR